MKHDDPTTKIDDASVPAADLARDSKPKTAWSDEDERRATYPHAAAHGAVRTEKRQGWPATEQRSATQSDPRANAAYAERQNTTGERDAPRLTGAPEEQDVLASDPRSDADTTGRHKPYIVEAMAPPSVPPVVPKRSGLPFDARTDVASSHDDPGVAPPATVDVPRPRGELPLDLFKRSDR